MNIGTPKEVGYLSQILTARRSQTLSLTQRQYDVLIGTILGDGYIYPKGKVQIEQSHKQKEYLDWKFQELRSLAYPGEPACVKRFDKRTNEIYISYRFWLRQYFRPWRELLYPDNTKVFPENLVISPLSLAVWYMDDGSLGNGISIISAEGFSDISQRNIQKMFFREYGLRTKVQKKSRKLVIQDRVQFFKLIHDYIIPSMRYKIS